MSFMLKINQNIISDTVKNNNIGKWEITKKHLYIFYHKLGLHRQTTMTQEIHIKSALQ